MKEFYVTYHLYWINHIVATFTDLATILTMPTTLREQPRKNLLYYRLPGHGNGHSTFGLIHRKSNQTTAKSFVCNRGKLLGHLLEQLIVLKILLVDRWFERRDSSHLLRNLLIPL